MNSNVNAFETGKASKRVEIRKPDRADVERAFYTIIRWTGADPEREGLIETPARVTRAFEDIFRVTRRIPHRFCRRPSKRFKAMTK